MYVYDERNRLTEAMDGATQCVQTGDTWTTQTATPTADETWTYTSRGTTATHTDTEGIATTYAFDAFEQLKIAVVDGTGVTNHYDALGRLIARNGATFAYDGLTNNLTAAPNGTGTDRFVRDVTGESVSATHGGITGLTWSDNHGDLVAVINPTTGDLITGGGFDPFGNSLPGATVNTLGFQGGYTDPTTGETNAHARWYNPETATFTTRDTWQLSPSPVTQTNRYLYGNASPLNLMDLSGHKSVVKTMGAVVFGPEIAVGLALYGGGVAVAECQQGRCGTSLKTGAKAAENAWESYWNAPKTTRGTSSGMRGGNGGRQWSSQRYGRNEGGRGPGSRTGNDSGYDYDIDFPDLWVPLVPVVPVVVDWTALITRPVGTALAAALLEGAVHLLDGLMKNEDEDTDQNQKQIELLDGILEENPQLVGELGDNSLGGNDIVITDSNGHIVGLNWQDDENCRASYAYGPTRYKSQGSKPGRLGGDQATGAGAYLCGNLSKGGDASRTIKPWDWPEGNSNKLVSAFKGRQARCHLVGNNLGGTGSSVANLVTCNQWRMNSPAMYFDVEREVSEVVAGTHRSYEQQHVIYISVPYYNGNNGGLSGIRVIAIGKEGYYRDVCYENELWMVGGVAGADCES